MSRKQRLLFALLLAATGLVGLWSYRTFAHKPIEEIKTANVEALPPPRAAAGDWPWWRGPKGDNRSPDAAPLEWGEGRGIAWKVPVPGTGHSTPILVGDLIVLTTAEEDPQRQLVIALDRATGSVRWSTTVHEAGFMKKHDSNTHASATPACDGERIFAAFLNRDSLYVSALDLSGKLLWQTSAGPFVSEHGGGPSPVLHGSLVIVNGDNTGGGFIAGLHRRTGEIVWRKRRNNAGSYATPVVAEVAGRPQLLLSGAGGVNSYDPATGDVLWTWNGSLHVTANTMTVGSNQVYASCRNETHLLALRPDGSGDVTATHKAWDSSKRESNIPSCPSLLLHGEHLYAVSDGGFASCYDALTGKQSWNERLGGEFWSSPLLAGNAIYAINKKGKTFVFRADAEKYTLLGTNELDGEFNASPVAIGGRLYLRSASHLYCIGP